MLLGGEGPVEAPLTEEESTPPPATQNDGLQGEHVVAEALQFCP